MNKEEAIKILKDFHDKSALFSVRTALETLHPELRESEDEKVKKEITELVMQPTWKTEKEFNRRKELVDWLEKQGEQKVSVVDFKAEDWYVSKVDGKIYNAKFMEQNSCKKTTRRAEIEKAAFSTSGIIEQTDWFIKGAEWADEHPYCNWLEKQGEQKLPIEKLPEEMKTIEESLGFTTQEECDEYNKMVSDIIMSADKVEPKFKVGDWIVSSVLGTAHIIGINDSNKYQLEYIDGRQKFSSIDYVNYEYDEWTIADAKDGDVLQLGEVTAIFKSYISNGNCKCYCSVCNGEFEIPSQNGADNSYGCHNAIPATKEQRDTLFAKIKEAGYGWDENNKMLKEIVEDEEEPQNYKNQIMSEITDLVKHYIKQKPTCGEAGEDMKEALRTEYEKGRADAFAQMQKEWSEEDENGLGDALWCCKQAASIAKDENDMGNVWYAEHWLKSIKQRYAWKPSDAQMRALEYIINNAHNTSYSCKIAKELLEQLRRLKGE